MLGTLGAQASCLHQAAGSLKAGLDFCNPNDAVSNEGRQDACAPSEALALDDKDDQMAQWNPLDDLMFLQDRMNRLFEDATQRRATEHASKAAKAASTDDIEGVETADWYPAADVYQNDGEYIVAIDLPGIDRSTLDISIDDDRLTIKGKRAGNDATPQLGECPKGTFLRTFDVPPSVDKDDIKADYRDGVLKVRLPRQPERKAQRIEIKVS